MNCDEVGKKMHPYLDGELEADQADALRRHLLQCASCADDEADARSFHASLQPLPSIRLPEDFAAATVRRAVRESGGVDFRTWWRRLSTPWRWAACAATLAGLFVGGVSYQLAVYNQDPTEEQMEIRFLISDASLSESYALAIGEEDKP